MIEWYVYLNKITCNFCYLDSETLTINNITDIAISQNANQSKDSLSNFCDRMKWLSILMLLSVFCSLSLNRQVMDYCSKSENHPFCNQDCLRPPIYICREKHPDNTTEIKQTHEQLEVSQDHINNLVKSLNRMRSELVQGNLRFNWKDFNSLTNRYPRLQKPIKQIKEIVGFW